MSGVSEVEKNSVDLLPNPMTEDDLADFTCELPDADRTAAGVCVLTNQPTNRGRRKTLCRLCTQALSVTLNYVTFGLADKACTVHTHTLMMNRDAIVPEGLPQPGTKTHDEICMCTMLLPGISIKVCEHHCRQSGVVVAA